MNLREISLERQATRGYTSKPIEQEKMDYVLECARLAPSACNRQPWKLYLIESDEQKAKIHLCYDREWAKTAPAYILCTILHDEEWVRPCDGKRHGMIDIAIIAEHICLAAAEQGLGTCWICNFDVAKANELFTFGESEEPAVIIPIGYSEEPIREKTRKDAEDIIVKL